MLKNTHPSGFQCSTKGFNSTSDPNTIEKKDLIPIIYYINHLDYIEIRTQLLK